MSKRPAQQPSSFGDALANAFPVEQQTPTMASLVAAKRRLVLAPPSEEHLQRKLRLADGVKTELDFKKKYRRQLDDLFLSLCDLLDASDAPCGPAICEPGMRTAKEVRADFDHFVYHYSVPGADEDEEDGEFAPEAEEDEGEVDKESDDVDEEEEEEEEGEEEEEEQEQEQAEEAEEEEEEEEEEAGGDA